MNPESPSLDVLDGHRAEKVCLALGDVIGVVGDVQWQKNRTAESSDAKEEPSHHSEEAEKGNGVQSDLFEEFGLFGVNHGGYPREEAVVNLNKVRALVERE